MHDKVDMMSVRTGELRKAFEEQNAVLKAAQQVLCATG
jgi:hypothetical protein